MSPPETGRNAPCPCGSGRKFKQCCMKTKGSGAAPAAPTPAASAPAARPAPTLADHRREAMRRQAAGDHRRAEAAWRAVVDQAPADAVALHALGAIRLARGAAAEAADWFRRAADAAPAEPATHLGLADACLQAGRADEARAACEAAIRLAPGDPMPLATRAMIEERMNQLDAAAATAADAERLAPDHVSANTIAARIARRRGDAEGALVRLDRLVARDDLQPVQHQVALSERAFALEAAGRDDEAWTAFVDAGRAIAADPMARRLDRDAWPRRIAATRRGLTRGQLERIAPRIGEAPSELGLRPVFLVGFPRSGTTMTESILGAHPAIRTTDEQPFLGEVKRALAAAVGGSIDDPPGLLARLTPSLVRSARSDYRRRVRAALGPGSDEPMLVDKLPLNLVDVALIEAIFPEARLLVALRDPRDVCLSCFQQWFGLNTAMVHFLDPDDTVRFYATVMDGWLHTRELLRLPWLEVRYEDTTADLEAQARRILAFLDVPWDEAVLQFHDGRRARAISTPSYAAVSEPVHRRAVARWRRYAGPVASWTPELRPFLEAFGYQTGDDPAA